ncbi:MAG TPA: hypothetical protein VME45_18480 [Stellaceae bacterium]|nr:hypothetical protein [Stellaceae bacterium]
MTLSRYFSGGKPQSGENRIGGGMIGLTPDPLLDPRQTLRGLVDVVALSDVDKCFEQFFEAFGAAKDCRAGGSPARAAAGRARRRPQSLVLTHPSAFPHDYSAVTPGPVAG